jgi:hypothetical protein
MLKNYNINWWTTLGMMLLRDNYNNQFEGIKHSFNPSACIFKANPDKNKRDDQINLIKYEMARHLFPASVRTSY